MKSNVNKYQKWLPRTSLLVIGAVVIAATVAGLGFFSKSMQDLESRYQDLGVLQNLVEARRANLLIQYLNQGQQAEAQKLLKFTLDGEMRQAQGLAEDANVPAQAEVKFAKLKLAAFKTAHPEYYPTPSGSVQIARH